MTNEELLEEYKRKYNAHDTYYTYSDDFTVWKKGQNEEHELIRLREMITSRGLTVPTGVFLRD
jgi:hypothetical protein